jgi:site-specific recombinase XerD
MSSRVKQCTKSAKPTDWLLLHHEQFLRKLADQGYTRGTLRAYGAAASLLCQEVSQRGLRQGQLVGKALVKVRAAIFDGLHPTRHTYKRFCLNRFIDHLVEAGVATLPKPQPKAPTALDRLREEYEAYLRNQRGLSEATIYHCLAFLRRFMTFRFGEKLGDLNSITPGDIVRFLHRVRAGTKPYRDKTPPTHLRNLFRFLFWSGKTRHDLANAIPHVAQPPESHLPRYLKAEAVERLIDAVRSNDPIGRRNYAMLLVIARLGLRAAEVIAVQLDDIDWRAGTILIRGKGKRHDRMPLPEDVGKAIVDYIRNGRRGSSRALFVSSKPPFRPFVDAAVLNDLLREAFERTGLKPPQRYVGSRLLRHSLATNMLRKGASLDEIGDVLRHRSRASTTIYAKHDIEALRSIARAWPVEGGRA